MHAATGADAELRDAVEARLAGLTAERPPTRLAVSHAAPVGRDSLGAQTEGHIGPFRHVSKLGQGGF
ncbi:MAG: hypothetical protein ACOYN0_09780 [Phycisphaerales bacterium]